MSQQSATDKKTLVVPETPELKGELKTLAAEFDNRTTALLPLLYHVQAKVGFVPRNLEKTVAEVLSLPPARVREVVTFYTMFRQKPVGRVHIQLCRNLSCTSCGSEKIAQALAERYGLVDGSVTLDGKLSLERVECLAACDLGPAAKLNDEYVGQLTIAKLVKILEEKIERKRMVPL